MHPYPVFEREIEELQEDEDNPLPYIVSQTTDYLLENGLNTIG